jgi:hypothetical protein
MPCDREEPRAFSVNCGQANIGGRRAIRRDERRACLRLGGRSRIQQPLHDQHVPPVAIEFAMTTMQANGREAAPLDEADAGDVVRKKLADQLVEPAVLGCRGERFSQDRPYSASARLGIDINAALCDAGVARTTAIGGEVGPADDIIAQLGDQERKTGVADPLLKVARKSHLGLERRSSFCDRHVVDRANRLSVIRRRNSYDDLSYGRHGCILVQVRPQAMAPGQRWPWGFVRPGKVSA